MVLRPVENEVGAPSVHFEQQERLAPRLLLRRVRQRSRLGAHGDGGAADGAGERRYWRQGLAQDVSTKVWADPTLPQPGQGVQHQNVTLHPWERPHEKGIDVLIALDVIEFILTDMCDVAIIVSLDRDLREIPEALKKLSRQINRSYRLEAAVPVDSDTGQPKRLKGFNVTHQITPSVFSVIRDDTDYTVADDVWAQPAFPANLAAARVVKGIAGL